MSTITVPLTPLKAFRIVHNLDSDQIVQKAGISRSYLTRLEQGAIPSTEIAERIVKVVNSGECTRERSIHRKEALLGAQALLSQLKTDEGKFSEGKLSEIHLLYPHRFMPSTEKE